MGDCPPSHMPRRGAGRAGRSPSRSAGYGGGPEARRPLYGPLVKGSVRAGSSSGPGACLTPTGGYPPDRAPVPTRVYMLFRTTGHLFRTITPPL